ncbi:hypothetical protein FQA39_LY09716 [Lamprigera yunnana]|nr:hypothetical protein FQA39_LY09716 [Lamprigera yunnana]
MDFNLDVRLKQLDSLEQYISSSWQKLHCVVDHLKWNMKEILKESQLIKCSVDPTHRIHVQNADSHVAKCTLRKEGYNENELFLSEPSHDPKSSISIGKCINKNSLSTNYFSDDHEKINILSTAHREIANFKSGWNGQDPDPKTADRLTATFSSDERLALYTFAVKNTNGPLELPEFNIIEPPKINNKVLTNEELRKQERDAKRRRIRYKAVHTNKKNYTEVMREVIDGQMQLYMDWLENKYSTESKPNSSAQLVENCYDVHTTSKRSSSVISRNSTYSSGRSSYSYIKSHSKDQFNEKHNSDYKKFRNNYKSRRNRKEDRKQKKEKKHEDVKKHKKTHSRRSSKEDCYNDSRKR